MKLISFLINFAKVFMASKIFIMNAFCESPSSGIAKFSVENADMNKVVAALKSSLIKDDSVITDVILLSDSKKTTKFLEVNYLNLDDLLKGICKQMNSYYEYSSDKKIIYISELELYYFPMKINSKILVDYANKNPQFDIKNIDSLKSFLLYYKIIDKNENPEINFRDDTVIFEIYAHNGKILRMLEVLCEKGYKISIGP